MDHGAGELELEEDIAEVMQQKARKRRDSMLSFVEGERKGGEVGRSRSLGPGSGKGRGGGGAGRRRGPDFEREVEEWVIRTPRRDG